MDGSATDQATVTLAGTDGVVISDGDVMKQALVSDFEVYMEANLDTMGSQFTSASALATVGTIGTGVWQGTAVASAYLDADTAHLTTDQTFSGVKTFSHGAYTTTTFARTGAATGRLTLTSSAGSSHIDYRGGKTSSDSISFIADDETTLFIRGDGLVGIGTASPVAALSVKTTTSTLINSMMYQGVQFQIDDASHNAAVAAYTTTDKTAQFGVQRNKSGGSYNDAWFFGMGEDTKNFNISKDTLGAALTIDTSGKVGIGTSGPSSKLQISGVDGGAQGLTWQSGTSGTDYRTFTTHGFSSAATGNYLSFNIANAQTTQASNVLYLEGTSKVGINTTVMDAFLNVNSGADNSGIHIESTDNGANLSLADNGGSVVLSGQSGSFVVEVGGSAGTAGSSATQRFKVDDGGKLHQISASSGDMLTLSSGDSTAIRYNSTNAVSSVRNWSTMTNVYAGGDFAIIVSSSQGGTPDTKALHITSGLAVNMPGALTAASYADNTPYPKSLELAKASILSHQRLPNNEYDENNTDNQLDHSFLHEYVSGDEKSRNVSATVSCLVEVIKDLMIKVEALENA